MTSLFRSSLRFKFSALCILLVLISCGLVTLVFHRQMITAGQSHAIEQLASEARTNAEILRAPFIAMEQDATILAATPAITGILRSMAASDRLDRADGSSLQQWRTRLEVIFASTLGVRPSYSQLRFIGLADGGREIVRVNRSPDGPVAVPVDALQAKGREPYMRALATATSPYFSRVTLNREHGAVKSNARPTIRLISPVAGPSGATVGAIVVNAEYEALLRTSGPHLADLHELAVINAAGDFITFGTAGVLRALAFHEDRDFSESGIAALFADDGDRFVVSDEVAAFRTEIAIGPPGNETTLDVIASQPADVFRNAANTALRHALGLSLGLAVGAILIAVAATRILTRPLLRLSGAIRGQSDILEPLTIEVTSCDEVGQLTRAVLEQNNEIIARAGISLAIFNEAADGILTVDRAGRILNANAALERMFGYGTGDLIGMDLAALIPADHRDRHASLIQEAHVGDRAMPMSPDREVRGLRKDGSSFALEVSISQVTANGEDAFVAIVRDATYRKIAESKLKETIAELETTKAELERSNSELNDFAHVASHDLKAPLRVIDNTSRWLEEDLEKYLDDDTRESMTLLRSRVRRMERLLDDLLAHSRIGRESIDQRIVEGGELMQEIRELVSTPSGFVVAHSDRMNVQPVTVLPLRTVLLNLVSNAIKHHDQPVGHVTVDVEVRGDKLAFSVSDDGPGIDPRHHDRIFQMFQTLKPRDQVEGSGMGLSMVRKIVTVAGGEITLRSAPGTGSTFTFTWPGAVRHRSPEPGRGGADHVSLQ